MNKHYTENPEILQKAKVLFIGAENYPDKSLISYYNLCKSIFGSALWENKPEILINEFKKAINQLTPREIQVLRLRYGINSLSQKTFVEIASLMGFSRSTASKICNHAIRRLRHHKFAVLYNVRIQERAQCRLAKEKPQ